MPEALNQRRVGAGMFGHRVFSSCKLNASHRSRPFGCDVDGDTSVRSLRWSRRDGWIVVIEAERNWTVRDVVAFGPIYERVPDPVLFRKGGGDIGIRAYMQDGDEVQRTERFKLHFGKTAAIAAKRAVGLKPAKLKDL